MSRCQFLLGDVFQHMATIPDHSVDLIVTSPPFLALRSYLPADHPDKGKEIGSETTPAAFLSTLLALTREWRRILAPHGSICVELGDTYSGSRNGPDAMKGGREGSHDLWLDESVPKRGGPGWPLAKSLCLIPSLYAGSLAYGHNLLDPTDVIEPLRVRNLIVWHRQNPPVGALGDKVRPATSYITTACVSDRRWFDLDAERTPGPSMGWDGEKAGYATKSGVDGVRGFARDCPTIVNHPAGAPPLDCWIDGDVWTIPTQPYKGAHYATYPIALPRRLINLMCPREVCVVCGEPRRRIVESDRINPDGKSGKAVVHRTGGGWAARLETNVTTLGWTDCDCFTTDGGTFPRFRRGVVLDPFAGSGTTLAAAAESGRDAIGIDLDERNLWLIRERVGLFLEETA